MLQVHRVSDQGHHICQGDHAIPWLEKEGQGLNLTWEVRQGIVCHSKPQGDFLDENLARFLTLEGQILRLAEFFSVSNTGDYGVPEHRAMIPNARALFVSDYMGDMAEVELALTKAADRGIRGVILQILDPSEEAFPFHGRTIFQSVGGTLQHETLKANDLRDRYLTRLAERKERLQSLCRVTGWQYQLHHTDNSAQSALLTIYQALDRGTAR